jgi:hypothetical protein
MKRRLYELENDCEREKKITLKDLSKLDDDLERVNFRKRRMEFVTQMLQEFDNLDPSALDIIFEYQSEDVKDQMAELKKEMKN